MKCNPVKFDDSYNLWSGWLYFQRRSATIIATFVRPGKTQPEESGDLNEIRDRIGGWYGR